jgi:uncharacterized protein YkwD
MKTSRATCARRLAVLAGLAGLAGLGACGGGGGGDGAQATPTAPSPPSASPTPAPDPGAPGNAGTAGTRASCNLPDFQAALMSRVNAARSAGASCGSRGSFSATGPLAWSPALATASLVHSDDMVANNFFNHTGSDGSSAGQRITAAGYSWSTWGENIAAGQSTVNSVVDAWMASAGHCANIMNARMRDIGVACVSGGAGNTYRSYWTMKLAAAR